jgi:hypothetical protein
VNALPNMAKEISQMWLTNTNQGDYPGWLGVPMS